MIPEVLRCRKKIQASTSGETFTSIEHIEPLSCDYRMPFHKARKEELPRLAAVLLGCSYDDLIQRANQYRMRRLRMTAAGVFAVSAAAISYLIWSNNKIRENYEEAQRNMSLYLADVSQDAFDDHDRISAIQNALNALPDEDHPRPVLAEAEYALAKATGVYDLSEDRLYTAVRKYETEYSIIDFLINPSGDSMAAVDQEGNLYIWNLLDHKLVYKEKIHGYFSDLSFKIGGDEKGFCIYTDRGITMQNWKTGEVIWNREIHGMPYFASLNIDNSLIPIVSWNTIFLLNTDGDIINEIDITDLDFMPDVVRVDQQGKQILLIQNRNPGSIAIMDLETSEYTSIGDELKIIDNACFDEDGNILICELENNTADVAGRYYGFYTIGSMTENIYKINASSGETIWQTSISFGQEGFQRSFETFDYTDGSGTVHKEIICNTGNVQTIIDLESGKTVSQLQWPAAIMSVISRNGSTIISLLENGDRAINKRDSEFSTGAKAFVDGSKKAIAYENGNNNTESVMILPEDKPYIIQYNPKVMPPVYKWLEYLNFYRITRAETAADVLAVEYLKDDKWDYSLSVYDQNTEEEILNCSLDEYSDYSWNLSKDGKSLDLLYSNDQKLTVKKVSLESGAENELDLIPEEGFSNTVFYKLHDNLVFYSYPAPGDIPVWGESSEIYPNTEWPLIIGMYDIETGKHIAEETVLMNRWNGLCKIRKIVFSKDGRHCLLEIENAKNRDEKFELYYVNTDEDVCHLDTSEHQHYSCIFNQSCSEAAIAYDGSIKILDGHGAELTEIPYKRDSYLSMEYLDDELFILTNEGIVYRYSSDHKLFGTYEVEIRQYSTYNPNKSYSWEIIDDTLYLNYDDVLNIVELDQSHAKATIPFILTYDTRRNNVLFSHYSDIADGYSIIAIPIFSTEELIQAGRKILSE